MGWRIELSREARRNLAALDPQHARRVLRFLDERVATLDNPRSIGSALEGARLGHLWRYRVGDFRIIADIQDDVVCVLVVRIGDRREVYRR